MTRDILLFAAAFLASSVEMVEALTIVVAIGVTRGWRTAMAGVGTALVALAVVVAGLGPALTAIPLATLRLGVGGLLLVFGLQWLRKAILRASGLKAMHDEEAIFRQEVEEARRASGTRDWYGFTVSFKGVFLEGLEVAFIVVTVGSSQHNVPLTAVAAASAALVVAGVGVIVHRPLARVPENKMKFAVGLMLTTFGIFWSAEGAGVRWPGNDAAIPGVLVFLAALSAVQVAALKARQGAAPAAAGRG